MWAGRQTSISRKVLFILLRLTFCLTHEVKGQGWILIFCLLINSLAVLVRLNYCIFLHVRQKHTRQTIKIMIQPATRIGIAFFTRCSLSAGLERMQDSVKRKVMLLLLLLLVCCPLPCPVSCAPVQNVCATVQGVLQDVHILVLTNV